MWEPLSGWSALQSKWSKWRSWSPATRRKVSRYALAAGLLVLTALLAGALTWIVTGSRTQALQAAAIMLVGLLMMLCVAAALLTLFDTLLGD